MGIVALTSRIARRGTRLLQAAGGIILVAASLSYWSSPAASTPTSAFEITDGNIVDSPAGAPYDWSALFHTVGGSVVPTGVSGFLATSFTADPLSGDSLPSPPCLPGKKGDPTVFTSGGSDKNGDAIPTWTYESGSVPNAKDDLSNVYAAAMQDGADTTFYFALERTDSNGDAHIDFEFLQNTIGLQPTGLDSSGCPSGNFTGSRTVGDILVAMNFVQGGTIGVTEVRVWNGTDYVLPLDAQGQPRDLVAEGILNLYENGSGSIACGDWNCRDASGATVTDLTTNAFVEGYLNVSALFGHAPACYSSFDAKTRSSQSYTSELKDFAFAAFDTCDARITIAPSGVNAVDTNHTFTAHVDANSSGAFVPKQGALVTGTITGVGSFVGGINTCTTDASGDCPLTITSADPGTSTVNVSSTIEVVPGHSVFRSTASNAGTGGSGPATKNWVDAYVKVTPNDVNAVNDPHTFTVEYGVLDGSAAGLVIATPTITPTVAPSGYTGYSTTCATPTKVAGVDAWRCTVTINSQSAATYTATATGSTTVTMSGGTPSSVTLTRTTSASQNGPGGNTGATKVYVDAAVTVGPNGINEVGRLHTVTGHVDVFVGATKSSAPAGTTITFAIASGPGSLSAPSCATVAATGSCTVDLTSAVTGVTVVNASTTVTVDGVALTRTTDGLGANSGSLTKRWIDAFITIGPSATNNVNQSHVFTVAVTVIPSGGSPVTFDSITPSVSPQPSDLATTCANPTVTGNTASCTVTINSSVAATYTANATAKVSVGGTSMLRSTDAAVATAGPGGSGPATKVYVAPIAVAAVAPAASVLGEQLVRTGASIIRPVQTAILLLLIGTGLVFAGRRRRSSPRT